MATPTPREMVWKVKHATEDELLLAMAVGSPQEDPNLGFTQGLADAELQRRGIARFTWLIWWVLMLQAAQVFIALMMWHPWLAETAFGVSQWDTPSLGRVVEAIGLLLVTVSAYLLWRGSEVIPARIRTIAEEGGTESERKFLRRRRRFSNIGFLLLGLGFALQLVSRVLP